jgi:hypothetical protein
MLTPSHDRLVRLLRRFSIGINVLLAAGLALGTARRMLAPAGVIDTDFTVFHSAWWLILHGQGRFLYDASAQRAAQQLLMGGQAFVGGLMAFLNPPHAALAGVPLGWIAERSGAGVAFAIWTGVNLVLLLRLDFLIRSLVDARRGERRAMVTFALLAYYPVFYTIGIGQLSLLLAVSVFELFRALEGRHPLSAAIWLIALSIKPQLLPPFLLLLALRRHWRALGWTAALGVGVAAICAALLGRTIWLDYLRNVRALEQFFAAGTPAYMMNLRGGLTRLLGDQVSPEGVYLVAVAAWIAAMAALALVLIRRGAAGGSDLRTEFGLTLAVSLFFNPHLFPQDAVLWAVALSLHIAGFRARQSPTLFTAFALSWPILFAVSQALDLSAGPRRLFPTPAIVVIGVALVWMAWTDQFIGADASLPAGR